MIAKCDTLDDLEQQLQVHVQQKTAVKVDTLLFRKVQELVD